MTGTQAIDRAAQLLVLVVENESSSSVGELAEAAGLPKSTVSRAVSALERQGLVQRSSARGSIRPGPVLLGLARRGVSEEDIAELCRGALDNLADATGETIDLAVAGAGRLRAVHRPGRQPPHPGHHQLGGTAPAPPLHRGRQGAGRIRRRAPPAWRSRAPHARHHHRPRRAVEQNWIRCGRADMRPQSASWNRAWWPWRRRCLMPTAGPWQRSASRGREFRIPSDRLDGFGKLLTKETETLSARLGYRPAGEGAA